MKNKGMTRARVVLLGVIALLVLLVPAQAQPENASITVEIVPSEPTSADEVVVNVELKLCDWEIKFFEEPEFFAERNLFKAKVFIEPIVIGDIYPPPPCTIVEASHTYYLGKLHPGYYRFDLLHCINPAGSSCNLMWREEFEVTNIGEIVCDYAGSDRKIDGADLIRAIQDYARGELSGSDLITIIQYYASGELCEHPLSAAPSISFIALLDSTDHSIVAHFNAMFYSCSTTPQLHWDFGDGESLSGSYCFLPTHTYSSLGPYTVQLTITDEYGRKDVDTKIVNGHPLPRGAILLDETATGITINVGDTIVMRLEGNPTTGFIWERTDSIDRSVLKPVGDRYIAGDVDPGTIGSGGTFEFRFEGAAPGTTPLEFIYWQPWTKEPQEVFSGVAVVVY